jgi:very-short-patch-repair endonuclease
MAVAKRTLEQLGEWLIAQGGIAHRDEALRCGFGVALIRTFVREGHAELVRRVWLALPDGPRDLRTAALAGGRISCTSLARRRGWWIPEVVGTQLHLHLRPGSAPTGLDKAWNGVTHWTKPLVPAGRSLIGTVEDALLHIAACLDRDTALVLWESAARTERIAPETLRAIRWTSRVARELAHAVTGLSDSGLETLLVTPLRRWGLRVRQQVHIAGHLVDVLVGDRLVVQIDGYEFHSSSAQRAKDIAHDAELRLRGYTVLRFSYAQIVHEWPFVERTVRRAVGAGLHCAG